MKKITKGQYPLRANISKKAINNVRHIQAIFALAGKRLTIEEAVDYILAKTTKK